MVISNSVRVMEDGAATGSNANSTAWSGRALCGEDPEGDPLRISDIVSPPPYAVESRAERHPNWQNNPQAPAGLVLLRGRKMWVVKTVKRSGKG